MYHEIQLDSSTKPATLQLEGELIGISVANQLEYWIREYNLPLYFCLFSLNHVMYFTLRCSIK